MGKLDPTLLRTFVEVARRGGEAAAAEGMSLSASDVNRRLKALELHLGYPLFERRGADLTMTPKARLLFDHLDAGFTAADKAELRQREAAGQQRLIVSALRTFAKGWLTPRLAAFAQAHPEVALRVDADFRLIDFDSERVDLAIRHGFGDYPGLESVRLFAPEMLIVGSPDLLSVGPSIDEPADSIAYHLLQAEGCPYWPMWLRANGISNPETLRLAGSGPSFARNRDLLAAAAKGSGLALVEADLARPEIEAGRLATAAKTLWPKAFAYYLVGKPATFKVRAAAAFRDWIVKEARR
ncbi:MAG: LysR substrate-binding domain-containing protein [Kiloniellales bacterium]|nr:LysR substrate-binding domain-containing protein [Kiloniellales bacterium]